MRNVKRIQAFVILRSIVFVLAASLATAGCVTTGDQRLNLLSTQQEIEIGEQLAAEIESQEKVLDNPAMQEHLRNAMKRT